MLVRPSPLPVCCTAIIPASTNCSTTMPSQQAMTWPPPPTTTPTYHHPRAKCSSWRTICGLACRLTQPRGWLNVMPTHCCWNNPNWSPPSSVTGNRNHPSIPHIIPFFHAIKDCLFNVIVLVVRCQTLFQNHGLNGTRVTRFVNSRVTVRILDLKRGPAGRASTLRMLWPTRIVLLLKCAHPKNIGACLNDEDNIAVDAIVYLPVFCMHSGHRGH